MAYWLLKTEPESFSYMDLERGGREPWNGVRNFSALRYIRQMNPGDLAFIYHTGRERAIVGVAEVVSPAYPDPQENSFKYVVVDIIPRYRLERPITLRQIKENPYFSEWELTRLPRLSVMPVKEEYWNAIREMGNTQ